MRSPCNNEDPAQPKINREINTVWVYEKMDRILNAAGTPWMEWRGRGLFRESNTLFKDTWQGPSALEVFWHGWDTGCELSLERAGKWKEVRTERLYLITHRNADISHFLTLLPCRKRGKWPWQKILTNLVCCSDSFQSFDLNWKCTTELGQMWEPYIKPFCVTNSFDS